MKINKLKIIIPFLLALSVIFTQPVLSGENPWDGDSNPAGGPGTSGGSGSGGNGDSGHGTPSLTRYISPFGPGIIIDATIQGVIFSFVTSVYSSVSGRTGHSRSVTKRATETTNISGGCKQLAQ